MVVTVLIAVLNGPEPASAQSILVPMDRGQVNHLKAYGLTYWTIELGAMQSLGNGRPKANDGSHVIRTYGRKQEQIADAGQNRLA